MKDVVIGSSLKACVVCDIIGDGTGGKNHV